MPTVDLLRLQDDIRQALVKSLQSNGNIHLETKDFFIVKKYIWMCIDLPDSTTSFQAKYPRDDLRPYMTKDPSLYDGLAAQFSINHHQCQDFVDHDLAQISELCIISVCFRGKGLIADIVDSSERCQFRHPSLPRRAEVVHFARQPDKVLA